MQVLEAGTSSSAQEALEGSVRPIPRERPAVIQGATERIRTGHGTMYVTINFDEAGSPFEVFSALGKAGGCDSAYLEAISRLVSLALRSGVDEEQVIDQLRGITCCPVWDQGVLVSSSADAVALAMLRHEADHHPSELMPAAQQEAEATQISLFTEKAQVPQVQAPQSAAFAPPQQTGSKMGGLRGNQCPECYSNLTFEEGCMKCYACGYSKC